MAEVVNETCWHIDIRHTHLIRSVTDLLQTLYIAVKEVRVEVISGPLQSQSQEVGPFEDFPTEVQLTRKHHKVQVLPKALDLGAP